MNTRQKIQNVLDRVPRLTNFGMGLCNNATDPLRMAGSRRELLKNEEQFEKTCQWLSHIDKRKTINKMSSSYGLKHFVEKTTGYISNGMLITAAIHCGFDYKERPNSPNVRFNMCNKSLNKMIQTSQIYPCSL